MREEGVQKNYNRAGKITLLYLLRILEQYSDENHHLKAMQIVHRMEEEYGWTIKWTNARDNICLLRDSGVADIHIEDGEYWIGKRTFRDEELHYLCDVVRTTRYIPQRESEDLIRQLQSFGTESFRHREVGADRTGSWPKENDSEMLRNLGMIKEAIAQNHKISFDYKDYDTAGRLRKRGTVVVATPYRMILKNGRYYLLACKDAEDFMRTYRLDLIADVGIVEEKGTELRKVKHYEKGVIDCKTFATSPYMYSEEPVTVTLRVRRECLKDVVDWFGEPIRKSSGNGTFDLDFKALPTPTLWWALQYLEAVEIIRPGELRNRITEIVHAAAEGKYRTY